jgi:hypothetical protein
VDLVARVRFHGQEGFVLVHVEHQGRRDRQIGLRLFLYAAWLIERYGLPVYPILLTSYDTPRSPEPDRFALPVRGFGLRDFGYRVVQLNRMNWRDFVRRPNPAAAALMAKMNIRPEDRVRAKLQILRLLATMRLDPEKMDLIAGFVENYLTLTAKEELAFERELDKLDDNEQKASVMELMTSWERKGRQEGQLALVKRQLDRQVGPLKPEMERQVNRLSAERLGDLAEALLQFTSAEDLRRWLAGKRTSTAPA